ncbi:MAG: hypothetical protein ACE5NG_05890 [bacterium]
MKLGSNVETFLSPSEQKNLFLHGGGDLSAEPTQLVPGSRVGNILYGGIASVHIERLCRERLT